MLVVEQTSGKVLEMHFILKLFFVIMKAQREEYFTLAVTKAGGLQLPTAFEKYVSSNCFRSTFLLSLQSTLKKDVSPTVSDTDVLHLPTSMLSFTDFTADMF